MSMMVGNSGTYAPAPFFDGYVPVRIEENTGGVHPDGDMASSRMSEWEDNSSMFGVVFLP